MLEKIRSNQLFRPLEKLKTKYWLYLISTITLIWLFLGTMVSLIVLLEGGENSFLVTFFAWMIGIGLLIILAGMGLISWYFNSISYEIIEDEVHVFRGVITRTRKIVPYRTITNIEVKQGPYDRLLGLGTIEIQTAGNSANKMGPEERIDGLPAEYVQDIQDVLISKVRKMRGSPGITHDMDEDDLLAAILDEVKLLRKQLNTRD